MASFKPRLFLQFRFPSTVSLFGLTTRSFSSAGGEPALCTRRIQRRPSPAATRESPTPIIFVRSPGLSAAEQEENAATWADWSGMFAEKGYTAIEIDIQPPPYSPQPFAMMVGALATEIRLLAIPFPPVIVAEGMGCLLTQSYIGDNPASGLVMVNPPPDADPRNEKGAGGGSWEWPVFNYEPHFPILVIAEKANLATLQSTNRVVKAAEAGVGRGGKGVSVEELVDGPRGEKSRVEVERWMDRCGY